MGRPQRVRITNEAGLYELVLLSRKPEAKAFKRWITHEVLPAIRKTGTYSVADLGRKQLAQMVLAAEEERERLAGQVAELAPDAARARQTMDADGLALVGTIAKRFGMRERALWGFLRDQGLIIAGRTARRGEPMARYIPSHFQIKIRVIEPDPDRGPKEVTTVYVTPRGEALIWKRLYEAGFVTSPTPPPRQLDMLTAS
jgi:anti-repressor protein